MASSCLLIFLALASYPAMAARVEAKAARLIKEHSNASISTHEGDKRFVCNPGNLFYQVMRFNAQTAMGTSYVLSFPGPRAGNRWQRQIVSGFELMRAPANIVEKLSNPRSMYAVQEGDGTVSIVLDLGIEGLSGFLQANPSKLFRMQLNEKTNLGHGKMLQFFEENPVYLRSIVSDATLRARHTSQTGLFSKGIGQKIDGRPYPGAQELVDWMNAACEGMEDDEQKFVEMILAASLIIVRNQVFGDRNHRSAMRILVEALPTVLRDTFYNDVISYSGSNATFRTNLYRAMHGGETYFPFNTLAPFNSGAWTSIVAEYRDTLNEWLTDHGHPLPGPPAEAQTAEHVHAPCHTDKECGARPNEHCCKQSTVKKRVFDVWCESDCFCMTEAICS